MNNFRHDVRMTFDPFAGRTRCVAVHESGLEHAYLLAGDPSQVLDRLAADYRARASLGGLLPGRWTLRAGKLTEVILAKPSCGAVEGAPARDVPSAGTSRRKGRRRAPRGSEGVFEGDDRAL